MPQQTPHFVGLEPFTGISYHGCSMCGTGKSCSNDDAIAEGWKLLQTCRRKYLCCPKCVSQSISTNS